MTQARKKKLTTRIITAIVLYVLAAILILVSVFGFFLRGSDSIQNNLNTMRTHAVLHAASGGLVDSIASQARSDKLKELRARKDFRTLGLDEVNSTCDAAAAAARAEAEALYSNATVQDAAGLENAINAMEKAMSVYGGLREKERAVYSDLYVSLVENVPDWTDLLSAAQEDDAKLFSSLATWAEDLSVPANAHLQDGFVKLAHSMAEKEQAADDAELLQQLTASMVGAVSDWTELSELDDEALWEALNREVEGFSAAEAFKTDLLKKAKEYISAAEKGETIAVETKDEGAATVYDTVTDYSFFTASDALNAASEGVESAYQQLWGELNEIIPDLANLDKKMQKTIRTTLENTVWSGGIDYSSRYNAYAAQEGSEALS